MTVLVKKVFISSKPSIVCLLCPPPCGPFSIQEIAVGGLSYKVKKPRPCKGTRHLFVTSFHHPLQHTPAANQLCREICAPITPETDVAAYQIPWSCVSCKSFCSSETGSAPNTVWPHNSEGIFNQLYSHRSCTCTGSLQLSTMAYCLRHSLSFF